MVGGVVFRMVLRGGGGHTVANCFILRVVLLYFKKPTAIGIVVGLVRWSDTGVCVV